MKLTHFAILTVASTMLSASAVAQGLPSRKMLTVDLAQAIAQEAMAKCRADGYKVTVRVVDADNTLKALLRDDGAILNSVQVSQLKTNAVILSPFQIGRNPTTGNIGVPIKVDNRVIGAIGVSGAPGGDKDADCANAALAKLADRLK